MRLILPVDCRDLLELQSGVISRRQAVRFGLAADTIDNQLRTGRWQRLHTGVYSIFTGQPGRDAELWAVVLRAGRGALLSHQTAAELHHITDSRIEKIHVTVPTARHPEPIRGAVVHRSGRIGHATHPTMLPPTTRVEDTVLDLTQAARSFDEAYGWLCRGIGRGRTTADLLQARVDARPKVRWRAGLAAALGDIKSGATSVLEHHYVNGVERGHGLPVAHRQAQVTLGRQHRYVDNLYENAGVAVELDGRAAHPIEQRWADMHRDNAHATVGLITLRYSWADVTGRPCLVAGQVAEVLRQRGTAVQLSRCGPRCAIQESRAA